MKSVRFILVVITLLCPMAKLSAQSNKTRIAPLYMPTPITESASSKSKSSYRSKAPTPRTIRASYQASNSQTSNRASTADTPKQSINRPTRLAQATEPAPAIPITAEEYSELRRSNRIAAKPVSIPTEPSTKSVQPKPASSHPARPLPVTKPGNSTSPLAATGGLSAGCDCQRGGCDCNSGGCDCNSGGCDCGSCTCDDKLCERGDCSCDQPGTSFFGRANNRSPISFSISRSGSGTCKKKKACTCGYNERNPGSRLAKLLPVSVSVRSNHQYRYISLFGGYFDLQDYRAPTGINGRSIDFNDGWQAGAKIGRAFANGIRLESEYTFRHATIDTYDVGNFVGPDFVANASFDAIDDLYVLSSMTNLLLDLKRFCRRGTTPYVGIGFGGAYVNGDIVTPDLGRTDVIDDTTFAYQFIAGVSKRLNRYVEGFAEYKYFGTTGVEVENEAGVVFARDFPFQSDNVLFGLRIAIPNSRGCNCNN